MHPISAAPRPRHPSFHTEILVPPPEVFKMVHYWNPKNVFSFQNCLMWSRFPTSCPSPQSDRPRQALPCIWGRPFPLGPVWPTTQHQNRIICAVTDSGGQSLVWVVSLPWCIFVTILSYLFLLACCIQQRDHHVLYEHAVDTTILVCRGDWSTPQTYHSFLPGASHTSSFCPQIRSASLYLGHTWTSL